MVCRIVLSRFTIIYYTRTIIYHTIPHLVFGGSHQPHDCKDGDLSSWPWRLVKSGDGLLGSLQRVLRQCFEINRWPVRLSLEVSGHPFAYFLCLGSRSC